MFYCYGKLICYMGSHIVTCHPAEVRIPPLLLAKAGTRFSDSGGMQGWVDLYVCVLLVSVSILHTLRRPLWRILWLWCRYTSVLTYFLTSRAFLRPLKFVCIRQPTLSAKYYALGCPIVPSDIITTIVAYLIKGLNSFDKTDREYSLAPNHHLITLWRSRSQQPPRRG